jgi:hypothetical protein
MKKNLFISLFFLILFNTAFSQQACQQRRSAHIRLVGDSWVHFPAIYQAYDSAMAKYGFADYFTVSEGSSLISMTAETWWQFPLARFALEASLNSDAARPIDIIMVSLGGNDVAFKIRKGDSLNVLDNSLNKAKLLMDSIFDFLHQKYPNGQIIWQSYDYTNFNDPCLDFPWDPYCDLWSDKGNPSPFEINRFMGYITKYQDSVIRDYQKPYLHFYNNLGLQQWRYGQVAPLRYPPYGTYPPRSVPMPGGNINYPSPHPAMGLLGIDTYHLGPQSYTYLAEAYMRQFISNYFRRDRDTTVYSMGQNFDGWADVNNITGTGDVIVGKRNTSTDTKGIFSFNTSFIPDNKKIKKASVFFKLKTLKTAYPSGVNFPQNFSLDIKSGAFGNTEIEGSDYSSVATSTDVACFAGRLIGNDYALRADLLPEALNQINKNGITQFRLSTSDENLLTFFNGDTTAFEGPYLDIYYDTTAIISGVINKQSVNNILSVFPNPAKNEINLQVNKEWLYKSAVISVCNTLGAEVYRSANEKILNQQLNLDISQLASGGYFISIENEENKSVGTFIKVKE